MDIKAIQKLIDLVKKNNVAELEVSQNGEMVHIVLNGGAPSGVLVKEINESKSQEKKIQINNDEEYLVKSPVVGTLYLSSAPHVPAFVTVGQKVNVGDTLCIIEAMKMFNRVEAERSGVIKAILVEDAQPVEYGQELFIME